MTASDGPRPFRLRKRIRFAHVDAAGLVFYPRFFELYNEVVEDWFAAGLEAPFAELIERDALAFPTVSIACQFPSPTTLGEDVDFELRVTEIGRTSLSIAVVGTGAGEPRLEGRSTLVCVRLARDLPRPLPIPDGLRRRIEGYCG